jgi:uncharacterized caspase-like protein
LLPARFLSLALPAHAERRIALVICNDRYANLPATEQLQKAVNDSRAVGDALARIGFTVVRGENLGRRSAVGKTPAQSTLAEMDDLWNEAKQRK